MTTQPLSFSEAVNAPTQEPKVARRATSSGAPPHGAGLLWFGGWLFTISFAKLIWWKAILGLVVWPYFLGETFR